MTTLWVWNPKASDAAELEALFRPYGLVYSASLHNQSKLATESAPLDGQSTAAETDPAQEQFGFVQFYTPSAAQAAFREIRKLNRSHPNYMFVNFARRKAAVGAVEGAKVAEEKIPLSMPHSIALANCYLGFNNWNSSVKEIKKLDVEKVSDEVRMLAEKRASELGLLSSPNKGGQVRHVVALAYTCTVELKFANGRVSEAEGEGMAIGSSADEVIPLAKKIAVTHARKAAFCKVVIVLFNGKVDVRIVQQKERLNVVMNEQEAQDAVRTD